MVVAAGRQVSVQAKTKRPVGRPRADGKPQLSREAVFAVAPGLIAEHGYEGTSLRMIAQALGAQAPSIAQLFKSKENLLNELVVWLAKISLDFHARLAHEQLSADVRLYKMIYEETKALSEANHDIAAIFYLPELRKPKFSQAQKQRASMLRWYQRTIDEGIAEGHFATTNAYLSAEQVFQLTETGIIALRPKGLGSATRQAHATADFILRGLLVKPSRLPSIKEQSQRCSLTMGAQ